MIEALRGLGYSTATALADVIDNSIAARADRVDVQLKWNGTSSVITVLDNGEGMNARDLDLAMRLGEKNPSDERAANDLGRFGLGLKTASFSQCRRLTVASRQGSVTDCLQWDLDVLAASADGGWHLIEGPADGSEELISPLLSRDQGTLVLWEKLDRIVTAGFCEQNFLDLIDGVERHLGMVFHRYLSGPGMCLRLHINGCPIVAWDPFLAAHAATWSSPVERVSGGCGVVEMQAYVLPHKDRLNTRESDLTAGLDGWTAQQGFYVYRNQRLLVAGSWLGLGRARPWTKEEAYRLARIRLDIPNTSDAEWKLDIRKSRARPPVYLRERLTRLAEDARERARRVFAHRGQVNRVASHQPLLQAWRAEHFRGGMRYRIDPDHPAISAVLDDAGTMEGDIRAMLRVIEETIPVQRIWLDTSEARETPRTGFADEPVEGVAVVLRVLFRNMIKRKGLSSKMARERLACTEPFNNYPGLVAALPDDIDTLE
ncbi:ATP-binding protein [Candidatus Accumulibacter sp. ACC003]|uniref:ATP-binding protein n=1 Tax=Candidatus Accumulibacter sp. ACC003 TaxID=2823334 RepID=UPI0025C265E9|nr:ATP-binding protein [Candidatus Accumulibacter sp. ACC003]